MTNESPIPAEALEVAAVFVAVCSNRPRPSVQKGAKGHQWWTRDPYHILGKVGRTLCGRDCSEWLTIGEMQAVSLDCCTRCAKALKAHLLSTKESGNG